MTVDWYALPTPASWARSDRRSFTSLAQALASPSSSGDQAVESARRSCLRPERPSLVAAAHVLCDLASQGWSVRIDDTDVVLVNPPETAGHPADEKRRVRDQELLKGTSSYRRRRCGASSPRWRNPANWMAASFP